MEITPKTTIEQIRLSVPDALEIFDSLGMDCSRCMGGGETIEDAAALHNIPVENIIKAINKKNEKGVIIQWLR